MSFVPPTSPVGVAGTAPAATVGTLVDAPNSLKAVDPGTIVKGTVEGRDRQGNMIVRTDHGVVAMRTAANFRPGTTVTMEVRVAGDGQHVVVLAADRRAAPAQQPPAQQPLPQQPAQQPAQQPSQQPVQQTAPPGMQQPTAASGGTQPAPAPAQGSGPAVQPAPAQPAPVTPPATPSAPQPAVSVASSPIIAASTQPPHPLQAGQTVQALLLQTLAGHASANAGANAGPATIASAQQAATPPGGLPGGTAAPAGSAPAPATPAQAASPQGPSPASPAVTSPTAPTPGAASPNNTVPTTGTPAPATPNPAATPQAAAPQGNPNQTGVPQTGTPQTGTPQTGTPQTGTPQATGPAAPAPSAAPAAPAPPAPPAPPPATSGQPVLPPSLTAPAASASMAVPLPGASTTRILQALPVGSKFAVTVNSVLPPAPQAIPGQATAPTPGLQPLPAGGATLTATVVGSTATGQPLLQTSFGLVTIPGAQTLPAGTGVTLGLSPAALGEAEAAARAALGLSSGTAASPGQPGGLSRAWPALNEAFLQLSQINPALAQTFLQTAIPQPGQQLAGALLFFMAALRGGDVRGWMGDQAARALGGRDGRSPLLSRLSDDMGQMVRSGTDSAGNEWRGFYIPLFDGRDLQQIRLFMRDPTEEGGGGKDGGAGHRFLIDLDLSKLGPLQLDGLARTERLDLIVRTHRALPRDIKAEIARLFEETAERVGLKGQVSFQATPHFPPLPFVEHSEIIEIHSEINA